MEQSYRLQMFEKKFYPLERLALHIEAMIFAADQPLTVTEIKKILEKITGVELTKLQIEAAINELLQKYQTGEYGFELVSLAGGYQFFTRNEFQPIVSEMLKEKLSKRLSTSQLEVLSIIAYKQPVSKPEIEQIRGVNCDYSIQKLLEKDLIAVAGRDEGVGKAVLYKVSPYFMNYFGINSEKDLPKLKEVESVEENTIGLLMEN